MSVNEKSVETSETRYSPAYPDSAKALLLPRCESGAASFTAQRGRSGTVLTVNGELDAANAGPFADYGRHCAADCDWLVVNLSGLTFIGVAGFSALRVINTRCTGTNVNWRLVPSLTVSRMLRVCDPDGALPLAGSVSLALAALRHDRGSVPQLFAQAR